MNDQPYEQLETPKQTSEPQLADAQLRFAAVIGRSLALAWQREQQAASLNGIIQGSDNPSNEIGAEKAQPL